MKSTYWFLAFALLSLALSGCAAQPAPVESKAVDLAGLPANIDVKTLSAIKDNPAVVVLDVREQFEYKEAHIPGVKLIPMNDVSSRLSEIPKDKTVVVTCRTGNRSSQVAAFLREKGYTRIHNLDGGIVAWQQAGLKVEK